MNLRYSAICLGCVVLLAAEGLLGQAPGEIQLDVMHLTERAMVVRIQAPRATNVVALETDAGIVVIDTEVSPTLAAAIRRRIEDVFGRSDFAYAINTHSHGDHTYGNQVFADAVIVGAEGVGHEMEEGEQGRLRTIEQLGAGLHGLRRSLEDLDGDAEQAHGIAASIAYYEAVHSGLTDEFSLTPPTLTFNDRMTLEVGGLTLEMTHFGLAHSETDILVFCPELNLIATGDLFASGEDIYIDSARQLHLDRWLRNLDHVLSDSFAGAFIVPGHGDLLTGDDVQSAKDFILASQAERAGKRSAFFTFRDVFENAGLEASLIRLDELRAAPDEYFFFHGEFDAYVYRLMLDGGLERAVPLFEKLSLLFPDVPNAFDSMGEAYLRTGEAEKAADAFEKCLELDPGHRNARTRLAELREPA